jgi:hypothetical protein
MILHFGLDFDGIVHTPSQPVRVDTWYAGPHKLLLWLEAQLGRSGYPEQTEHLRIELYRQALSALLTNAPPHSLFFTRSYEADRLATASTLLEWRDELLLSGWDFQLKQDLPPRLRVFAETETLFRQKIEDAAAGPLAFGQADRFDQALKVAENCSLPIQKLFLHDPEYVLTPPLLRFLQLVRSKQIPVETIELAPAAPEHTALGKLQRGLTGAPDSTETILLLKSHRDSDAAVYLSQILRENPGFKPFFLIPEMNLQLEQALVLEGFPYMGILSASLARPTLQVLKLAPAFLWEPVDVFKIMEFVTLPVKPFDDGLSLEIARVMSDKPGLFSDTWFAAVYGYLERGEIPEEARDQYTFWFDRRRYKAEASAPKRDAIGIYSFLHEWAHQHFEKTGRKNTSLLVLAEQARRIRDLLEALPETRLTFLELERIVRTIYDPSPVQMAPAETAAFSYVHNAGALAAPVSTLVWWNCTFENTTPRPDKWQREERNWMEKQGVLLSDPVRESRRLLHRHRKPVMQTTDRLILMLPEMVDGKEVVQSLLPGDMEALFGSMNGFKYHLDDASERKRLSACFALPEQIHLPIRLTGRPQPFLHLPHPELLSESPYETYTNLESLFYFPHRWFFRQKTKLYPSSLLSITSDYTLMGSLAHRFFEMLLKEDIRGIDKKGVGEWVMNKSEMLLEKEGATMLLYGREPERNAFLNRVKYAAWSLISLLRANAWEVEQTEQELEGTFCGMPIRGKADLVLRRGTETAIIDLKWSGARRRKELIQNGEDLQLMLYAHLLGSSDSWPHTAYFILEDGKMIARNRAAFSDAVVAGRGDEDHGEVAARILEKMEKTFHWRMEQIRKGTIELRTARTAVELEALYESQLMELLEMKQEDARWDDYRTLLEFM